MPGKEATKQNYPPCNRAFTLRMMNPMSYQEGNVSPFDREIQPLVKRSIAKSHLNDNATSFDDVSVCSDSSYQDGGGLYDIDEHEHTNGHTYREQNSARKPSKSKGNDLFVRSHSFADGFEDTNGGFFNRNSAARNTLPVRLRTKSAPKVTPKRNGLVRSVTPSRERSVTESSTLKRSQSLKERPNSCNGFMRSSTNNRTPKSINKPTNTLVNNGTTDKSTARVDKSSKATGVRIKVGSNNTNKTKTRINSSSNIRPKVRSSREDDSDSTFSEADGYSVNGRHKSSSSTSTVYAMSNGVCSGGEESAFESSFDSVLQPSCSSLPSSKPDLLLLTGEGDAFNKKVTDICNLISEKHPGDFQILENLIEMQHAYEERNNLVTKTIKSLQRDVHNLEHRLNNTPSIPSLMLPLMHATKTFENQLQKIIESKQQQTFECSSQIPDTVQKETKNDSPSSNKSNENKSFQNSMLDEITNEANDVANKIEQNLKNRFSEVIIDDANTLPGLVNAGNIDDDIYLN